jgi:hypothetical protein
MIWLMRAGLDLRLSALSLDALFDGNQRSISCRHPRSIAKLRFSCLLCRLCLLRRSVREEQIANIRTALLQQRPQAENVVRTVRNLAA